jgi:23S rRNA pseudouridine1911/1915/1917 synthase
MLEFTIEPYETGSRLDKLIVSHAPGIGRAGAKKLFAAGKVRLRRQGDEHARRADKGDVGAAGDTVLVELGDEAPKNALPDADAPLTLVLERADVVLVDKPAGQPSAPLEPGELGTVANALLARFPEMANIGFSPREPGICHRLDTDTSGLLIAARSEAAFTALVNGIKDGRFDKRYLLLCRAEGLPETGTIDIPLAPHPKDRKRVLACLHPRDVARLAPRPASTSYEVLRTHGDVALVEVRAPRAARHQIRAHFAAIDHPLLGDVLYGGEEIPGLGRHALHAHHVAWGGDRVVPAFSATSPLPEALAKLLGEGSEGSESDSAD